MAGSNATNSIGGEEVSQVLSSSGILAAFVIDFDFHHCIGVIASAKGKGLTCDRVDLGVPAGCWGTAKQ